MQVFLRHNVSTKNCVPNRRSQYLKMRHVGLLHLMSKLSAELELLNRSVRNSVQNNRQSIA